MRVLIACDKFKNALTAPQACRAVAEEIRRRRPEWELDECPLADGGEGFGRILTGAAGGLRTELEVTGPEGSPVRAGFGLVAAERIPPAAWRRLGFSETRQAGRIAIVEMAEASGLALVADEARNPWKMTTVGTGELLRFAARAGADGLLLGVGGSATHDLGAGALAALGMRFETSGGAVVYPPYPRRWSEVEAVRMPSRPLLDVPLRIACDVSNPLLGPSGAAAVFGPQKGLPPEDIPLLDAATERLARQIAAAAKSRLESVSAGVAGAGAAGGIAFGLMVGAGARLVSGAELIFDWLDLARRLAAADIVITGEGRFDDSSLGGKGPGELARRAAALGRRAFVFAGRIDVADPHPGLVLRAITPDGTPLAAALRSAEDNLRAAVAAERFQ